MKKKSASHYLEFSRKEKNGIVICLALILFLIWLPYLYEKIHPASIPLHNHEMDFSFEVDSNSNKKNQVFQRGNHTENNHHKFEENAKANMPLKPIPFDPNKVTYEGWLQMGLKEKTVKTILNYTSKGGKFRKPDDIKKIWGITEEQTNQLMPYVKIEVENTTEANRYQNTTTKSKFSDKIIDINKCDSADLERLPGIGARLAQRILNYRESLGGFYTVSQIGEVYGLADTTFQKIKPQLILASKFVKKLNINKAMLEELKTHPYIKYKLANAIIQYRNQHGNFIVPADLKKIITLDNNSYNKIINYITIE